MTYETRETFKRLAERIAGRLMAALRAGELARINIDIIRAAITQEVGDDYDDDQIEKLEEMTTRRVVEKCR